MGIGNCYGSNDDNNNNNNNDDDNNDNNDDDDNNHIQRRYLSVLQSPHSAANHLQHVSSSGHHAVHRHRTASLA